MDAVFSFLFGTRTGFAILFAGGILLFAILAFVMEKRTHKTVSYTHLTLPTILLV